MTRYLQPGDLRARIGFYQLISADDGYGNTESGYPETANFQCRANIKPRLGGEKILADRLSGTNFVNITVRQSSRTRTVDPSWKIKDERSGVEYEVRSIIDPYEDSSDRGAWFEMLCEKGVAIAAQAANLHPGPYFAPSYFGGYFTGLGS